MPKPSLSESTTVWPGTVSQDTFLRAPFIPKRPIQRRPFRIAGTNIVPSATMALSTRASTGSCSSRKRLILPLESTPNRCHVSSLDTTCHTAQRNVFVRRSYPTGSAEDCLPMQATWRTPPARELTTKQCGMLGRKNATSGRRPLEWSYCADTDTIRPMSSITAITAATTTGWRRKPPTTMINPRPALKPLLLMAMPSLTCEGHR